MPIVTLGELLDQGRAFELRLERYYSEIRDRSKDNGVRLLTYYLARHRRHQDQALAAYDQDHIERFRKAELKNVDFILEETFPLLGMPPEDVSGEALLKVAIGYDQALVGLYRSILEQPLIDEIRVVVESLIRVEERDIVMMKKMMAMHYF